MVNNRKGFTATQSKITSRRLRTATLGTHMPRRSSRHMNGDSVGFSSPRKQKRAARGYVESVLPSAGGGDGFSKYGHRVSRREYSQGIQRRARIKRIGVLLACVLVVVCVGAGVGVATFFGALDTEFALKDSDASSALVAAQADKPFYAVVAADLDPAGSASAQDGPDAVALVRVDVSARSATIVSVPSNLQVSLSDGKTHPLYEAAAMGDASLVNAVAGFAGVSVSHYVKIDAAGVVQLVDALGGVEVDVSEEVDDPVAGGLYIPSGTQTLDGQAALTFLRASNFANGLETQTANQRALLTSLSVRLIDRGSLDFLSVMDAASGSFRTDMPINDVFSLAESLRGMDASAVKGSMVPGYEKTSDGVAYYVASGTAWTSMMERVAAGDEPATQEVYAAVDPASFTLTVRNGGGITGAATQIAQTLQGLGFNVAETGNTDTSVYTETLVIYKDSAYEAAAQTVLSTLGVGRAVSGGEFYTFDTDVLVILGKDWKPAA